MGMIELNKIYNMDCIEGLKSIEDEMIDLILTDPPWGIGKKDYDKNIDALWLFKKILPELDRIIKSNRYFLLDISFGRIFSFNKLVEEFSSFAYRQPIILYCNNQIGHRSFVGWNHFRTILCYAKKKDGCDKFPKVPHKYRDVIEFPMISLKNTWWSKAGFRFPNPKSVYSYSKLIEMFSYEGNLVFDPFMGSGTTAIACKKLNRNFIGFEINPNYCDIAEKRLSETHQIKNLGEMFG